MKRIIAILGLLCTLTCVVVLVACDDTPTSDQQQHVQQEQLNLEANRQVGLPNITNFREKKLLKDIFELRDKADFATYTYVFSEQSGKFTFLCNSIGYGIPYATQYTNPEVVVRTDSRTDISGVTLPQADPNALFSPPSADGTWVVCAVPDNPKKVTTVYVEPRITTVPFKLPANIVINP